MKSFLWYVPLLLFLFGCNSKHDATAFPEPDALPAIQVNIENREPKIGEPIPVQVRLTSTQRMVVPPLENLLHPAIEILEETSTETEGELWQRDIELDIALYSITNVTLFAETTVESLSDPKVKLDIPFHILTVASSVTDDDTVLKFGNTELPDFRGPEALKRRRRNLWISFAAAVIVALLTAFLVWWLKQRPQAPPPPVIWHQVALKEMATLRELEIWKTPDVDASAVALSLILRRYIEGRFEIHAPERTTEEFLQEVQDRQPWPESNASGLHEFFTAVDRIKFAGDRPGQDMLDQLMSTAEQFVQRTAELSTLGDSQ